MKQLGFVFQASLACSVLLSATAGCFQIAWAQATVPPGGVQSLPGLIQQYQQRPEAVNPVPEPQLEAPPEPQVEQQESGEIFLDPALRKPFLVQRITLEGQTLLDMKAALALIADYEGRELSFLELNELASKLTELYRQRGTVTSLVYIKPQRVIDGHVVLTAAEGVLGEVDYEPGRWFKRPAVLPRIDATTHGVFDITALRRSLRRINDNPDLTVGATLSPGQNPNETNVLLEPQQERFPFHVMPFWDNLGRRSIGYQRFGVTSTHNNLAGLGDRALNSVSWTRTSFGVVNQYSVPVGAHGTSLHFDHAFSTLRVGKQFTPLDIRGLATIYSPSIRQELYNSERIRISTDLAFDFKDITTTVERERLSLDRLRVLRPGINWDSFDPWGRTLMRHEVAIGLDVLGAHSQPPGSRTHTTGQPHGRRQSICPIHGQFDPTAKIAAGLLCHFTGQYPTDAQSSGVCRTNANRRGLYHPGLPGRPLYRRLRLPVQW